MGGGCLRPWGGTSILLNGWAALALVWAEHAGGLQFEGMSMINPSLFYLLLRNQGAVLFNLLIFLFHTNFYRRHCMSYRVSSNFLFMVGTRKSMLLDLMKIILVKGIYTVEIKLAMKFSWIIHFLMRRFPVLHLTNLTFLLTIDHIFTPMTNTTFKSSRRRNL
jgi:hypothetical protein